jgi:hypothetical protein
MVRVESRLPLRMDLIEKKGFKYELSYTEPEAQELFPPRPRISTTDAGRPASTKFSWHPFKCVHSVCERPSVQTSLVFAL